MSAPSSINYDCFYELIAQLRAEGHTRTADLLDFMLHRVAWTTGSELVGELGSTILEFQRNTPLVGASLQQALDRSLEMVRQIWPDLDERIAHDSNGDDRKPG